MEISASNIFYLSINTACALANAYLAPQSFAISFAVGVAFGAGVGLKRRFDLILVDINERIANVAKEQINTATEGLQTKANAGLEAFNASSTGQYTANALEKISPLVRPFFKLFLYFSGYGKMIDTGKSFVMGFDEQRKQILKKLDCIPGWKGTVLSITALAANVGYIATPILSKVFLFSGFPMGFAAGLYIAGNFRSPYLKSETVIMTH